MIIDTSAIIAIIRKEPEAKYFADAIEAARSVKISAATFLEASIVVDRADNALESSYFDELIVEIGAKIVPISHQQAIIARNAYRAFGKGSGHKAGLNMGDCFSYALARDTNEPLLFKGDDFSHTDILCA